MFYKKKFLGDFIFTGIYRFTHVFLTLDLGEFVEIIPVSDHVQGEASIRFGELNDPTTVVDCPS